MSDFYDPNDPYGWAQIAAQMGGDVYDEEMMYDPYGEEAMYEMLGLPGSVSTRVSDMGTPLPYDIGTYAKQGNAFQDDLAILSDPMFAMQGAALGFDSLNYGSFVPEEPAIQMPPAPVVWSPTLDGLRQGGGNYAAVADMVEMNAPLAQINSAIRTKRAEGAIASDEEMADLMSAAQAAQKEWSENTRSQMEYESELASTPLPPTKQTPMQIMAAKAGLADPLAGFDPAEAQLPEGLTNSYRAGRATADADRESIDKHMSSAKSYDVLAKLAQAALQMEANPPAPIAPSVADAVDTSPNILQRIDKANPVGTIASAPAALGKGVWNASGAAADWLTGNGGGDKDSGFDFDTVAQRAFLKKNNIQGGGFSPLDGNFNDPSYLKKMEERGQTVSDSDRMSSVPKKNRPLAKKAAHLQRRSEQAQGWARRAAKDSKRRTETASRNERIDRQAEANRQTAAGNTPFQRQMEERRAFLEFIRGGG